MENYQHSLTIGLAGDTMLGRSVNRKISQTGYLYPWGDLLPLLRKTDLNIINLETTLTKCTVKIPKTFNFRADLDKVNCLKQANIDLVTLANNHILDYTDIGLLETLKVLKEAGINHVGAGKNIDEASKPVLIINKGIKIGILGYTDNEEYWIAGKQPGTNYLEVGDIKTVENDLSKFKETPDILIVSIHWGPNMRQRPTDEFITFAHQLVARGADIIHGHSAHIFQGIEVYNNSLILYDTGDFVDDYVVDPYLRNDLSFFYRCEICKSGVKKLSLIPVLIKNMQVNLAKGEDRTWCLRRIKKLSADFATSISENGEIILPG